MASSYNGHNFSYISCIYIEDSTTLPLLNVRRVYIVLFLTLLLVQTQQCRHEAVHTQHSHDCCIEATHPSPSLPPSLETNTR